MKDIYVRIWSEAAALRMAGQKDKRLSILNQAMARFGVRSYEEAHDDQFRVTLPDAVDEMEFMDVMMSTPEVVQIDTVPFQEVSGVDPSGKEGYQHTLREKFKLWQSGDRMPEVYHARALRVLVKCLPEPQGHAPR